MATIVDRPHPGHARVAAHHVRDPAWARPPNHTRRGRGHRPVRHGGARRRYVWRDIGVALLTVAVAAGVVVALLQTDPAARDAVLEVVSGWRATAQAYVGDLPWP